MRSAEVRIKRRINLRLLLITVVAGAVVGTAGYFWYQHRVNNLGVVFEQRAAALEKAGQWRDAAGYLRRYLQLEPQDLAARVRLIQAMEPAARTPAQKSQLVGILYQTIGQQPDRYDLRLKLATLVWEIAEATGKGEDYARAETEARGLKERSPNGDHDRVANRLIALSLHRRVRRGGPVKIQDVAQALNGEAAQALNGDEGALKSNPGDVALAVATASLYRDFSDHAAAFGVDDPLLSADRIMDDLVEADPTNPDARIARYRYRRSYMTAAENARQDLDTVLAKDPDHVEALLLLADEELLPGQRQQLAAAEEKFRKVIELRPAEVRGHMGLARVQVAKGDREQAVETLMRGQKHLEAHSLEMDQQLAEVLLELNRPDEAAKVIADFDDELRRVLPQLTTEGRMHSENVGRLLRARLNIARNKLDLAIRELSAIIASVGNTGVGPGAEGVNRRNTLATVLAQQGLQARAMLAAVHERLGRFDLACAHWLAVAELSPNLIEARWRAGLAYLRLGRPQDAIPHLNAYSQLPNSSPGAKVALVQAHLQRVLLDPSERHRREFEVVLKDAQIPQLSLRWELPVAEAMYGQATGNEKSKSNAMAQLQRLEEVYSSDAAVLEKLVVCYQQLDASADVERALALYDKCQPNNTRRALLRSALHAQQGRAKEAAEILSAAAAATSGEERDQLQEARIRLLMASRQWDEAQSAVTEFINAAPTIAARLILGLEIAHLRQDLVAADRWEDALKNLSTVDDFNWRYYRARRLIALFATLDSQARSELESLISSLREDRPQWPSVVTLAGRHFELTGDHERAIAAYQQALELGDRRSEVFERIVTVLYGQGRYSEANDYLERLRAKQPAGGQGHIDSLAIAIAYKEDGLQEALKVARQTVDRGSTDPMHYIWLAQLLSLDGEQAEAEQRFQDSVDRFPKDPRVWNALFMYYVRTKQADKARDVLKQFTDEVALAEPAKHYTLAQGYDVLGDSAAAQEEYRATIASDPKHVAARLGLGKSLLKSDIGAAREQLEKVLTIEPENSEAERHLAALWAASGDEDDWFKAVKLLQNNEGASASNEAAADDRMHAILLSRRGRTRAERLRNCREAQRILTDRVKQSDAQGADLDRLLLASLYEQEAAMLAHAQTSSKSDGTPNKVSLVEAARQVLMPLVNRKDPSPQYLTAYIQLVLRHLERAKDAPDKALADMEQRRSLIGDARLRIAELESSLQDSQSRKSLVMPVALRIRLLLVDDQVAEARQVLHDFANVQLQQATSDAKRAKLLLQLGSVAMSSKFFADAEGWYRQLISLAPNSYILLAKSLADQKQIDQAVEVCLEAAPNRPPTEVAIVLTQLMTGTDVNSDLQERVRSLIAAAVEGDRDNVNLLMSIAVQQVTENNYEEAIKLFRRVLELEPNHTLALNNLATLLSERPDQLEEARKLVEQAMAIAGRSPPLLDTLGTILIRAGKHKEAVPALEEAVAGAVSDPRFYFHLAVAYQRAGQAGDAHDALDTARKHGLDSALLTSGDRNLLIALEHELGTNSKSKT